MVDGWSKSLRTLDIRELPAARVDMLRLRKPSAGTVAAVDDVLGVALPAEPNRAAGTSPRAVWMGPDEWMIVDAACDAETVEAAAGGTVVLIVPVGAGRYAVEAGGSLVRDLLAKAVSIDLHPSILPVDHSAMTLFAQVPVVIDHVEADRFRLWFDVSHRHYVRTWFEDALVEFGLCKALPARAA